MRGQGGAWRALARLDHPDAARGQRTGARRSRQRRRRAAGRIRRGGRGLRLRPRQIRLGGAAPRFRRRAVRPNALHRTRSRRRGREPGDRLRRDSSNAAAPIRRRSISASVSIRSAPWRAVGAPRAPGRRKRARSPSSRCFSRPRGSPDPYLAADARCVHAAGGTPAQELALRARLGARLFARARRKRLFARRRARRDRVSPDRRRRSVRHLGEVPRAALALGAGLAGLRPRAASRRGFTPRAPGGR